VAADALAVEEAVGLVDAEAVELAATEATDLGAAGVAVPHPAVKTPAIAATNARVRVLIARRTALAISRLHRGRGSDLQQVSISRLTSSRLASSLVAPKSPDVSLMIGRTGMD
jgi:hypothetical protein